MVTIPTRLRPRSAALISALACASLLLGGVMTGLTGAQWSAAAAPLATPAGPERVVVIGDSYTGGSGVGGAGASGWPELTWARLRTDGFDPVPTVSGQGGSGYVTRGTEGTVLGEEAARLVTPDDQTIMFFGGLNDNDVDRAVFEKAVQGALTTTRATAPCAVLFVLGPVWPDADPPASILAKRDVLQEQSRNVGAVFIDPIGERWLMDDPTLIGDDHVHPTDAGHAYLAGRIEPIMADLLSVEPRC